MLFLNADRDDDRGVRVIDWKDDEKIQVLAYATGREGLFSIMASCVSWDGSLIYLRDLSNPRVFQFKSDHDDPFKKIASLPHADELVLWPGDQLVFGNNYPLSALKGVRKEDRSSEIDAILKKLPKDAIHEVNSHANFNPMVLAGYGQVLAVGYGMQEEVLVFRDGTMKAVPIKFRGRLKPPETYKPDPKAKDGAVGWLEKFHRLYRLAWHKDQLFGLFRKGFSGLGIWVRIDPSEKAYTYDNNHQEVQLISMGRTEVVLGKKEETKNGDVTWRLWRSSSLP